LEEPERPADPGGDDAAVSRELEEAYVQLEKLLAIELAERGGAGRREELVGEAAPDAEEVAGIEEAQREIGEKLGETSISTTELVNLVARLIPIERQGREDA